MRNHFSVCFGHAVCLGWVTAASLLPGIGAADSHLQTVATATHSRTIARVDFVITIPPVLALEVRGNRTPRGRPLVAVYSNGHSVTLAATHPPPSGAARPPVPQADAVLLTAAARQVLAAEALCSLGETAQPLVCTLSMP